MTELAPEVETSAPEVIFGHEIRPTNCGDIIFINTNYVTPKVLDILISSINEMGDLVSGHGLYTVVFRIDGRPRVDADKLNPWLFVPDAKCAVCNLSDCVELAFTNTMDGDKGDAVYCNVAHVFWKHLITGFFHEAHHAHAFITDYDELISSDDARQIEELKADEFANYHSFHMAKLMNVEPEFSEPVANMLNEQWIAYKELITEDKNPDDHSRLWLKVQSIMQQHGSSFFMPAPEDSGKDNFQLDSFKEFMRYVCPDDISDSDWDVDTTSDTACDLVIPDPNVTAEGTPATVANVNSASDQYLDDYDEELPPAQPTVMAQTAAPIVAGMQGVAQQFVPAAPVAPVEAIAPISPVAPVAPVAPVGEAVYQPVGQAAAVDPRAGQFQATVKSLYLKMFNQIFQACGYNPQMPQVFGQKEKIAEMVPLTPDEAGVVAAMDCYNEVGQIAPGTPCQNWLSGVFIDKAQQLPGYTLTLSTLEGAQIFRKFVPQNPNKVKYGTQELTKPAIEAKAGNQIMWIIDPSDKKNTSRVYNGVFQKQQGYDWIAV